MPPARYRVVTTDGAAERELRALSPVPQGRVRATLRELSRDYRAKGAKPLEGIPNTWTVRVNRLRIVFELDEAERTTRVTRIRPRPIAYDGIERPPRSRP